MPMQDPAATGERKSEQQYTDLQRKAHCIPPGGVVYSLCEMKRGAIRCISISCLIWTVP